MKVITRFILIALLVIVGIELGTLYAVSLFTVLQRESAWTLFLGHSLALVIVVSGLLSTWKTRRQVPVLTKLAFPGRVVIHSALLGGILNTVLTAFRERPPTLPSDGAYLYVYIVSAILALAWVASIQRAAGEREIEEEEPEV